MQKENTADNSSIMIHFTPYFFALLLFLSFSSEAKTYLFAKNEQTQSKATPKSRELQKQVRKQTQKVKTKTRKTASATEEYPPPPADRETLPAPIQEYLQKIEDVCQFTDFQEQRSYLQPILEGIKKAIDFYKQNYFEQINPSRLSQIDYSLFNIHVQVFWDGIYIKNQRWTIAGEFVTQHCMHARFSHSEVGVRCIEHDWAKQIYRGLYCLSHGRPSEEPSVQRKENKK